MVKTLKWTSVLKSEVEEQKYRLEANVFKVEAKKAKDDLHKCKFPIVPLTGVNGIATAYHRLRFKRVFVDKSDMPIYQPSQITELNPKPEQFISFHTKTDIEALKVREGQILMTCSGTIGKCTMVSQTLAELIFSHDLLRINAKDQVDRGYIYAFCRTEVGQTLLTTNNYGAVISHIEPEHLDHFLLPYPDRNLRKVINEKIQKSFALRDQSNILTKEAEEILIKNLNLPSVDELKPTHFVKHSKLRNYSIKLSQVNNRLDASYHIPEVDSIVDYLLDNAASVTPLNSAKISKEIILPGRFKRHYVDKEYGTVFLGGKQIYELDPYNKKYLSIKKHGSRIESQLFLEENMIAVTCSGTIGKVNIIPKHWENWTMSQHVMRVVPLSSDIAGYLYIWLNSDYGKILITRQTYGSVVDEIDSKQLGETPVPILKDSNAMKKINDLALLANKLRAEAYFLEQEAIDMVNSEVIYTQSK